MIRSEHRVAVLLHGGIYGAHGKTGLTLLRYSAANIVAVIDRQSAGKSLPQLTGIPRDVPIVKSIDVALDYRPNVLVLGIAPLGGKLPDDWRQEIKQAIAAGTSLVNGLHTPLKNDPELKVLLRPEQWIWDVRQPPSGLIVSSGAARLSSCLRVLTVGTDMGVGKMSTSLELHHLCCKRGLRSQFLASGQTGMMLMGRGIPLDAIQVDFAAGAVEQMVMQVADKVDILHIEGQGSLLHPASTATLPLIRGSQPTHLILVHRAGQTQIQHFPHVAIPPLSKVVRLYETVAAAGEAFAPVKVAAIALNTAHLDKLDAKHAIDQVEMDTGLPCTDPVRFGADRLLNAVLPDK